jgi:hypothetical protein
MLRWHDPPDNPQDWPILRRETVFPAPPGTLPEFQIFQPFLFLQPAEVAPGTVVPADAPGINLAYAAGALSGEIEVGTFPAATGFINGIAVVQMRYREIEVAPDVWEPMFTDPDYMPAPGTRTRVVYGPVRQQIGWRAEFVVDGGTVTSVKCNLGAYEMPYLVNGTTGSVATPLRVIDSSHGSGMVCKVGYPAHPGVARKDDDPTLSGSQDDDDLPGDQRAEPVTPITDWDEMVKAIDK